MLGGSRKTLLMFQNDQQIHIIIDVKIYQHPHKNGILIFYKKYEALRVRMLSIDYTNSGKSAFNVFYTIISDTSEIKKLKERFRFDFYPLHC